MSTRPLSIRKKKPYPFNVVFVDEMAFSQRPFTLGGFFGQNVIRMGF
jgi:hypothetical protein